MVVAEAEVFPLNLGDGFFVQRRRQLSYVSIYPWAAGHLILVYWPNYFFIHFTLITNFYQNYIMVRLNGKLW